MAAALDRLLLTTIQTFVYYSKPAPDWKLSRAWIVSPVELNVPNVMFLDYALWVSNSCLEFFPHEI